MLTLELPVQRPDVRSRVIELFPGRLRTTTLRDVTLPPLAKTAGRVPVEFMDRASDRK